MSFGFSYVPLGFPGGSGGKASACSAGDLGSIPGSGGSPGEGSGTHSSTLAWRILWTEEPGRLQSMGSQRLSDFTFTFIFKDKATELKDKGD